MIFDEDRASTPDNGSGGSSDSHSEGGGRGGERGYRRGRRRHRRRDRGEGPDRPEANGGGEEGSDYVATASDGVAAGGPVEQGSLPFPGGEGGAPRDGGGSSMRDANRDDYAPRNGGGSRGDGGWGNNDRGGRRRRGNRNRNRRDTRQDNGQEVFNEADFKAVEGLFEPNNDGSGFLRLVSNYYLSHDNDAFIPRDLVRRYEIRPGSMLKSQVAPSRRRAGRLVVVRIDEINDKEPDAHRNETPLKNLLPCDPFERFRLETDVAPDISMRIIDLLAPIGRGQRALIVAPPRSGKTIILQKMANAIHESHPEVKVIILLIDERPEEVTDFKRNTKAEVIASCLDEGTANHVKVTELVLEKLKRQVEAGHHVVCLLDSITRLGRAYNNETKHSGRILSGGVDAKTLAKPKAFFGAARTIEGGGSITIIATALVDTGSRMDQVIFEEFKGTGNMELVLSRQLANNRIFPAIDIAMTGTRKEEKLLDPEVHRKVTILRRVLNQLKPNEAMRLLIERMEKTGSNVEFLSKFDVSGGD